MAACVWRRSDRGRRRWFRPERHATIRLPSGHASAAVPMPVALIAAVLASLGIHGVVLFVPEVDLSPHPEPITLQAEIVLKPRAVPVQAPELAAPPAPARKPQPSRTKAVRTDDVAVAAPASTPAENPATAATEMAVSATASESKDPPPAELALPPQGEIVFTVLRGDPPAIIGRSVQSWDLHENSYRITSVMETVGLAALLRPVRLESESRGRIVANGLAPESFVSRRPGRDGGERVERVDFDWASGLARFASGASAPLPAGAQDLLSFNFQLGWLSKTGEMAIATVKKLGRYQLELVGEELLETPIGLLRTLHFRAPGETTTEVWLAADRHLLPVKIRHIDKKAESFDQLVEEIRIP